MEEDSFFSSRCRKGLLRSNPVWRRAMTTTEFFFAHSWNKRSFWQSQVRARAGVNCEFPEGLEQPQQQQLYMRREEGGIVMRRKEIFCKSSHIHESLLLLRTHVFSHVIKGRNIFCHVLGKKGERKVSALIFEIFSASLSPFFQGFFSKRVRRRKLSRCP